MHSPLLMERAEMLIELRSACDRARLGHGGLVVISGAAGTGKSSLLAALRNDSTTADLRLLSARGGELEQGMAFGVVRQLFEMTVASLSARQREAVLSGVGAPAAWAFATDGQEIADSSGAGGTFAVLHGIYWLAANLAHARPLLLLLDDLHWADEASLRALLYLVRRITDMPIVAVAAWRPDEPGTSVDLLEALRTLPEIEEIVLRPLAPSSSATLLRSEFASASDAACKAFHRAGNGNPLYLHELLRALEPHDEPLLETAIREASLPALGDRVLRRLKRSGDGAVPLAEAVSVLGDRGGLADAAVISGIAEPAAARLADRMRRIEILADVDPPTFVHPVIRRSIYDAMPVTQRDALHREAASRMRETGQSSEAIAAQLARVRPARSSATTAALCEAAEAAVRRGAPDSAKRWILRALDEDAARPGRARLLHRMGQVELAERDPSAIEHLQTAHRLTEDERDQASIALDLATMLNVAGRADACVDVLSSALAKLGRRDPELALELEVMRAVTEAYDPRMVARFDADRDRLRALAQGDSWAARALGALMASVAILRDEVGESEALLRHSLRDDHLIEQRNAGDWAGAQALTALTLLDDQARLAHVIDAMAGEAERSGAVIGWLTAIAYRGWVRLREGDLAAGEAVVRPGLEVGMQNQLTLVVATAASMLQDVLVERDTLAELAAIVESIELPPGYRATCGGAMLLEARGRLLLSRGRRDEAVSDLVDCASTYRALGFGCIWSPWRSTLALALPVRAKETAIGLAQEERTMAERSGSKRARGIALRACGLLRGGDDGTELLRRSVTELETTRAHLELARSLVAYGGALRRQGRRADAREPLSKGMDVAHRCSADRLVDQARQELRATGARPRRIARTGVDSLTPSELRAARLVAEGRTNSQVAQELFVSLKTVETHLSHVYAKLDLNGSRARQQLRTALSTAAAN